MRDYPNMSYCMNENTVAALQQIINAIHDEGEQDFLEDLSKSERRAFEELAQTCQYFAGMAERMLEEVDTACWR